LTTDTAPTTAPPITAPPVTATPPVVPGPTDTEPGHRTPAVDDTPDTFTDDDATVPVSDLELPFAWENGPAAGEPDDRDTVFRFPSADDPEPATRRLLGMSLYASLLGMLGLAAAVRGVVAVVGGHTAAWYEPTLALTGVICVALVVGAFLSIHRRVLPWALMLAAAVPLAVNMVANSRAF
jgi:hypothetical protein